MIFVTANFSNNKEIVYRESEILERWNNGITRILNSNIPLFQYSILC
jgi:hypothetical protein